MKLGNRLLVALLATACCNAGGIRAGEPEDVVLENAKMRLVLGADASVTSLKLKSNGEELIDVPTDGYWYNAENMTDESIAPNLYD